MEDKYSVQNLLNAGVHFGHLKSKWNPNMAPYIFMEHNGIHIIDLNKTHRKLHDAMNAMKNIVRTGRKILFVATKKQAKEIVKEAAQRVDMPFVTERWLGGMLTNFTTVKKSIKRLSAIDKMFEDGSINSMVKKERLFLERERTKLSSVLGGISDLKRIPAAIFIVDIKKEHLSVKEARKLDITTFALVDTNTDPSLIDFPIPANDDSAKSIELLVNAVTGALEEGLEERKAMKKEKIEQE